MSQNNQNVQPGLFGIQHSNRDFSKEEYWGKNQFNSSFPAALLAYMDSKGINPIYIKTDERHRIVHSEISPKELLGIDPLSDDAQYDFETEYPIYNTFYSVEKGKKHEHIDLVMKNREEDKYVSGLEIKLTAIPDSTTKNKTEDKYGCEIVVRPPTICYLACSICAHYSYLPNGAASLLSDLSPAPRIDHWETEAEVEKEYQVIEDTLIRLSCSMHEHQVPLIVQPIWKTKDFSTLSEDCLDVFVWSNLAVIKMMVGRKGRTEKINRPMTALVWLYKMLWDYASRRVFDYSSITKLNYGKKNDKAFSINGTKTHPFMACDALTHPRIKKSEIKNVILGDGQKLLMPERRLDAFIVTNPEDFE